MEYIEGLVSAIIPTYKRSNSLVRAVESVLNQTYQNIECIVINDNENVDEYTFRIKELLKDYIEQQRIIFLEQPRHVNGAVARNFGIRHAKGEYIGFLDDDDMWMPTKIEEQIAILNKSDEECGGVSCLIEYRLNGKTLGRTLPYKGGYIYKEVMGREVDVATGSLLLKRTCLDKAGYFDENLTRHQELQLLTYFTYKYKLKVLPKHLLCMNLEDESNRPKTQEKIRKAKKDFFKSVEPIFGKMPEKDKKVIEALNRMDIAYVCLKQKEYRYAISEIIKILETPSAFGKAVKRYKRKRKERTSL